jgi:hypothetical protein
MLKTAARGAWKEDGTTPKGCAQFSIAWTAGTAADGPLGLAWLGVTQEELVHQHLFGGRALRRVELQDLLQQVDTQPVQVPEGTPQLRLVRAVKGDSA